MKVAVAVLTYNRQPLFRQTIESLKQTALPYERVIVDNGSTDGTAALVAKMGGICNQDNRFIGHGLRVAMKAALRTKPDLVLFTADDYLYCRGWLENLVRWWENAPRNAGLATLNVEPVFHWNTILGVLQVDGLWSFERRTVPGACWSFRPALWPQIAPLVPDDSHKYDHRVCTELRASGWRLYALPLAEHAGAGQRTWKS